MQDLIKRLLIAILMALCVSLLFLGGKQPHAAMKGIEGTTTHWVWPADGVITDLYGTRDGHHKGIDIAADIKTPIHTVDQGTVTKSYYSNSYGHVIFIKHGNNLETVYAHLNKRFVEEGARVKQGEVIGEMGNTGDSSGVHLHFEIHEDEWTFEKENAINPEVALGEAVIGQPVAALGKKGDGSVETIGKLPSISPQKEEGELRTGNKPSSSKTHIVQRGETLWSIARKYGSTPADIAKQNDINHNRISVGQELAVPTKSSKEYIVSAGETLFSIARKMNTTVNELKEANGLVSDQIHPQQILTID